MNELNDLIKELFGPDPFFIQLVQSYVDSIKDYNDMVKMQRLLDIASDKEVCDDFLKYLSRKTYDFEGALNIKGVTAKWISENTYYKDALKIYSSMVWARKQLKDVNYDVDPSFLFNEAVYGTPNTMRDNNNSNDIGQKYNIEPSKNHARIVYGPPRFTKPREVPNEDHKLDDMIRQQNEKTNDVQREDYIRKKQEELVERQREDFLKKYNVQKVDPSEKAKKEQEQAQLMKEKQEEMLRKKQEELMRMQQEELIKRQQEEMLKRQQEEILKKQQEDIRSKQRQEDLLRKEQEKFLQEKQAELLRKQQEELIKQMQKESLKQQEQKYDIKPSENHPARVYGPPKYNPIINNQQSGTTNNASNNVNGDKKNIISLVGIISGGNDRYQNHLTIYLYNLNGLTDSNIISMLHSISIFEDIKNEFLECVCDNSLEKSVIDEYGVTAKTIASKNSNLSFLQVYDILTKLRIKNMNLTF